MIEFTGSLTGAAKTAFLLKQRKTGVLIFAIAFPLVLPLVFFMGHEMFHEPRFSYIMGGAMFIMCVLLAVRPMSKKEISQILPQRIYANKNHIVCIAEQYKESKPISDVSKVIDYGSIYDKQELQAIFHHEPAYQGLYITSASSITACPILMNINHNNQVKVVTTDLFAQMKAPLDSGVIFATIFQNPFMQGRKAVKSIYQHLQNEKIKDVIKIPPQIVMRTNIDSFYINESSSHNTDPI